MTLRTIAGTVILSATLLLLSGSPAAAQKGAKKAAAAAKRATDLALILELQKTAHLLSKANHDYKGHRAAAVKEIHHAVRHLKSEAKLRGVKGAGKDYTGPEPQPVSDAQLKKAMADLKTIHSKISGLGVTEHRGKAAGHVTSAVSELDTALKVAPMKN